MMWNISKAVASWRNRPKVTYSLICAFFCDVWQEWGQGSECGCRVPNNKDPLTYPKPGLLWDALKAFCPEPWTAGVCLRGKQMVTNSGWCFHIQRGSARCTPWIHTVTQRCKYVERCMSLSIWHVRHHDPCLLCNSLSWLWSRWLMFLKTSFGHGKIQCNI